MLAATSAAHWKTTAAKRGMIWGAEATMSPDDSAPGAPPAGAAIRGSGVEPPRNRVGWDGRRGRKLVKPDEVRQAFSPQERLLILDTWQRSGLPAGDFAPLVGLSKHTLYLWKKRFSQQGPAEPRSSAARSSAILGRTWDKPATAVDRNPPRTHGPPRCRS